MAVVIPETSITSSIYVIENVSLFLKKMLDWFLLEDYAYL